MLPRRLRLSRHSFKGTIGGKTVVTPHFSLVFGPSPKGGVAVVISKKVAGRSVDRHLLKRRVLSCVRDYASPTRFLVIYAKKGSFALSFTELTKELKVLFDKLPALPS